MFDHIAPSNFRIFTSMASFVKSLLRKLLSFDAMSSHCQF